MKDEQSAVEGEGEGEGEGVTRPEGAVKADVRPSPVPRPREAVAEDEPQDRPPAAGAARGLARRTWWLPWAVGAVAVGAAAVTIVPMATDSDERRDGRGLSTSTHQVVYEITGTGKSPEIKYVVDGVAETETIEGAELPWRKEISIEVGPAMGVVQIMATNTGKAPSISCRIVVDGTVVHQASAPGEFSAVACSSVIRPSAG